MNQFNQQNQEYMQAMMFQRQVSYMKKKQRAEILKAGFILGGAIIAYIVLQSVWALSMHAFGLTEVYENSVMFKYAFNIIAVDLLAMLPAFGIAALMLKKNFVGELLPSKKVGKAKFTAWVLLGMGGAMLANLLVSWLITFTKEVLGYELTQNDYGTASDPLSLFVMFFAIAVAPAIFEEFAFRCCALGALKKFGKGFAVFSVSIIFGLIHGNVIQFVFAFFVGLILAYITVQTDNVLIAMVIHGINNGRSVINDMVEAMANEDVANKVSSVLFIVFLVLGIISLIYLLIKKSFKREKKQINIYDNNFFVKIACMAPGMIIPFAILIKMTQSYVTKI